MSLGLHSYKDKHKSNELNGKEVDERNGIKTLFYEVFFSLSPNIHNDVEDYLRRNETNGKNDESDNNQFNLHLFDIGYLGR